MIISVIIPVFNSEKYINRAVASALAQKETGEVILVEDASHDNSLKVCKEIEQKYQKVKLLRHYDNKNHGAGASRNLGINNAKFDYIAFLDADDFYLKNRFYNASKLFSKHPNIDGIYEATGFYFYDKIAKKRLFQREGKSLTSLKKKVHPSILFEYLLESNSGTIHLDGIIIKKELIKRSGLFFENLKLHQDTAFILQISEFGRLIGGNLDEPVALRGIHENNRILNNYNENYNKYLFWKTLFYWSKHNRLSYKKQIILYYKFIYFSLYLYFKDKIHIPKENFSRVDLITPMYQHPVLFINFVFLFLRKIMTKQIDIIY